MQMSSYPEYNLNNPRDLSAFYSQEKVDKMSDKKKTENLNKIWLKLLYQRCL